MIGRPRTPLTERFWKKVDKAPGHGPEGDCWEWCASTHKDGYGQISDEAPSKKMLRAHRVSYELHHGFLIANLEVQHSCNNPPCVNPAHLSQDTPLVNAKYRNEQGRQASGEKNGLAKLTEEKVVKIRRDYVRGSRIHGQPALARKYGVSQQTICKIVTERMWK